MIALWYREGALERAPYQDGRSHVRLYATAPLTTRELARGDRVSLRHETRIAHRLAKCERERTPHCERRRFARTNSGPGRRSARPVAGFVERRTEALLYLSEGESVGARHLADVERWLAGRGIAETS